MMFVYESVKRGFSLEIVLATMYVDFLLDFLQGEEVFHYGQGSLIYHMPMLKPRSWISWIWPKSSDGE